MAEVEDPLTEIWQCGYSIAELWGFAKPCVRGTSAIDGPHHLLWGILRLAEDQVNKGFGHNYFRQRIESGDWIAIGRKSENGPLQVLPPIANAKFGRRQSAIGDAEIVYVDVRLLHRDFGK